jgi:carboxyl-terminal processing protease
MSINKIDKNIYPGLNPGGNQNIRTFGKCWSSIRRFLLILLLIILLPVSSVAQNLTCSRLPALMKGWLANHYAIKSVKAVIRNRAVDQ